MPAEITPNRTSWFMKFVESLFAAIAVLNVSLMIVELLPQKTLIKLGRHFFNYLLLGQALLGIVLAITFSIYWHRKELKARIDSGKLHAWLRGILRYWLVLEICTYGFAKILRTQFAVAYYRDDMPVGQLNGFNLTWNYFAHSYTMAVIIALVQIGGAILLLFRRTTLLGAAILLPVMVNIVLINYFFNISPGAFMNSVLFTLGLLFLLLLNRSGLIAVFLRTDSDLPEPRLGFFRNLFRFLAVGCAFGIIFYFTTRHPAADMAGKWTVDRLTRNGDTLAANAWLHDSTAWSTAYMEESGDLALCPNPYVYEDARSVWAEYKYDSVKHQLRLIFERDKPAKDDTLLAAVSNYNGKHMTWKGVMGKDTLLLQLSKVEKKK